LLWGRAERDIPDGDYDGACFNSEEAIQLATKALLYRFSLKTRIHGSKTLLARLRNLFMDAGRENVAKVIGKLVSEHRDALDILEKSYIMASYGEKQGVQLLCGFILV